MKNLEKAFGLSPADLAEQEALDKRVAQAKKNFYGQEIPTQLDTPDGTLRRAAYHLVLQAGGHANLTVCDLLAVRTLQGLADQAAIGGAP